jgi:DNA-binding PadR family transcriptional regulator
MARPDPATFLPLKTDVAFILMALDAAPLHGYAIIKDVEARSQGDLQIQTGALYRTLRRLLLDHLIVEVDRPAGEPSEDERRRYYRLTPRGREALTAEGERLERLARAIRGATAGKPLGST